ncbi:glycerophosphodiester phosphodiesterase family protein [Tenacibaculum sp. ZS6-P6]|uniref:glycerophosphodiester phosphodiesterase family protein n=1 Tax=Tenacibaculum sp. ZS6-P6 TaxID=3447503 RepID=UPI003F9E6514
MKFFKVEIVLFILSLSLITCKTNESNHHVYEISTKEKDNVRLITSFKSWSNNPIPLISAHRGGPYPGFPENAIETFENITKYTPVVIECDVAMSKDSVLVLMHDKTLNRTTTGYGNVQDKTYEELKKLNLVDNEGKETNFKIPTLDKVLSWGKGKVLFTLDIKRGVPFNKVVDFVEKHNAVDYAAIITYRIQDAKLIHQLNKEMIISVSAGNNGAIDQIEKANLPAEKLLGFVGTRQPDLSHYNSLKEKGIKTILGTLGNLDKSAVAKGNDEVYLTYIKNGANIIATDRPLEVAKVFKKIKNKD